MTGIILGEGDAAVCQRLGLGGTNFGTGRRFEFPRPPDRSFMAGWRCLNHISRTASDQA